MCRWKNKNGVEDLKKAKWYLEHLIDNVENRIEEKDESDLIKAISDLLMEDEYNDPYGIYFVDIDIF